MFKCVHAWQGFFLANGAAFVYGQALDLRFNPVEGFDLLDVFLSDWGYIVDGKPEQLASYCPAVET